MVGVEWYYARGGKQVGPISAVELKQKATAGEIRPDDLVWKEGLAEWTAAKNVRGLFDDEPHTAAVTPPAFVAKPDDAAASKSSPSGDKSLAAAVASIAPTTVRISTSDPKPTAKTPGAHPFDGLLAAMRKAFPASFVEKTGKRWILAGHIMAFVAAAAFVAQGVLSWTKGDGGFTAFSSATLLAVLLVALQYAACKLFAALERLIQTTEEKIACGVLFDCVAAIAALLGFVLFVGGIAAAFFGGVIAFIAGLTAFCALEYFATAAMNLDSLNVHVAERNGAGEEAVGLFAASLRLIARAAPGVYFAGLLFGAAAACFACVCLLSPDKAFAGVVVGVLAQDSAFFAASAPIIAYLTYLFGYLIVDLCRAVLAKNRAEKDE